MTGETVTPHEAILTRDGICGRYDGYNAREYKNVAVILGAGAGTRFNGGRLPVSVLPKQFLEVAGMTVFEHSVGVFETFEPIDEIALVVGAEHLDLAADMARRRAWTKVKKILAGGGERHDSTLAAIQAYERPHGVEDINLIFHDAVRPLVTHEILSGVVAALEQYEAVGVAVPSTDTVFLSDEDGRFMSRMPDRRRVYQCQTPQAFRLGTIRAAYERALRDPDFRATDDCGVVLKYLPDTKILIVGGDRRNIKLTHAEDLPVLETLLIEVLNEHNPPKVAAEPESDTQ